MTCYDLYRLKEENDRLRAELAALREAYTYVTSTHPAGQPVRELDHELDDAKLQLLALLAKVRLHCEEADWCPLCDRAPADDHTGHAAGCPLRVV